VADFDTPNIRDGIERARRPVEGDAEIAGTLGLLSGS
jgi:hypothetical protein